MIAHTAARLIGLCGLAMLAVPPAQADVLIKNVTVYDGRSATPVTGASVLVRGERIAEVSTGQISARGARTVDGKGKFLIPGLIDSHIHLRGGQGGSVMQGNDRKPAFDRHAGITALHGYLYSGVTAVYDSGNYPDFIFTMRAEERSGKIVSPRIFAAGGTISVPGGYAAGPTALKVENWDQARAELDRRFSVEKPDMLKLILDRQGLYQNRAVPTMSPETFKQVVQYAQSKGVRSTVHVSAEWDAQTGLDGRVDAFAHPVLRATLNDSFVERLAASKTPVSTTLVVFSNIARVADDPTFFDDPLFKATVAEEELTKQKTEERQRYISSGMAASFKLMMPYAQKNIKRLHDAGVVLALGTDRTLGPTVHQELELLHQAGIPPAELVRIATLNGAQYLGREKEFGSIEPGKLADLVLLTADPGADVRNFRTVDTVYKGGKAIDLKKLDLPVNAKPH
jgi:imidazolonepropionase-like amidohydrolase